MCRVLNRNRDEIPSSAIYIGRGSKWGNPFVIGRDGTRNEVIELYRTWLMTSGLMNDVYELTDKDLVCYCTPKKCHGDVLLELANAHTLDIFF
jgi:hypothetical protein